MAEIPGIEVDFDELDSLVAAAEGPEVAPRFHVAGGSRVKVVSPSKAV
jgi:hypothetical protein